MDNLIYLHLHYQIYKLIIVMNKRSDSMDRDFGKVFLQAIDHFWFQTENLFQASQLFQVLTFWFSKPSSQVCLFPRL